MKPMTYPPQPKNGRLPANSSTTAKPMQSVSCAANTGLRYHFLIAHRETGEALWVGSQCVLLFGVAPRHLQHKLRQARQPQPQPLDEARILALIAPLHELHTAVGARDQRRIRWMVGKFDRRTAFSPYDLAWLFQAMLLCGIHYEAQQYPLTLKTKKDRSEMASLPLTAARLLADCLTPEQITLCEQLGIRT